MLNVWECSHSLYEFYAMLKSNLRKIFTRKRVIKLVLLLLLVVVAGFVFTIRYPKVVAIQTTEVTRLEGKTIYLNTEVVVHNANYFPINLKQIQNQIFINNTKVAVSSKKEPVTLQSRRNTILTLEVALDVKTLAKIHPELKKQETCAIDIKGKYAIDALISTFSLNSNEQKTINLKENDEQIAAFTLGKDGLKVQNMKTRSSASGLSISLNLGLKNVHPFDYTINLLDIDITPPNNNSKLGHWRLPQQKVIHASTLEYLPVKFHIANNKLLSALSVMYAKKVQAIGSCQVVVAGEVFNIPIKQAISLPAIQLASSQF